MTQNQLYIAVMFPYPSGSGLHVGHWYNYAVMDTYCRIKRYQGHQVFQPFGYDAFGLPAENYARQIGGDPAKVTFDNIQAFRAEMKRMNTQYQERLVTSDYDYQKCTQWIFLKLYEKRLAYKAEGEVNYCPSCATVLANEQVKDERCERCGSAIEKKVLSQWYFKITDYRDRLIKNLDWIDYPEKTIAQQRHWLANLKDWCVSRQRKWGCPIPLEGETDTLDTFVDSSFYFIRYCDPFNNRRLCDRDKLRQVDLYVGGNEHACMHLIYARFINMFLYDLGITPFEEPFKKVVHQGMIRFAGEKMSKSKGNIVDPKEYDPDELRMYLMFIGHYFDGGDWNDQNISGIRRFLARMNRWLSNTGADEIDTAPFEQKIFRLADAFKFNKCVSEWMIFYNTHKDKKPSAESVQRILTLFRLFAPGQ